MPHTQNILTNFRFDEYEATKIRLDAQSYFGTDHEVDEPYRSVGSDHYRFDIVTDHLPELKISVANSKNYRLR
jgi:hypothetical protein